MKRDPQTRITLAYSPASFDGQYLTAFPLIEGMKCTGWAADDLFQNYEDALKALAKIAVADLDHLEAAEVANAFFDEKKEQPHSYYDWEEDEDQD